MLLANFRRNVRDLVHVAVDELLAHLPGAAPVIDETTRACLVPGRPHPATNGLLCFHHLEELGTWLRDIEAEAARLDPVPSMSSRLDGAGGGSLASQQAPAVLDAIVYTDPRTSAHGHRHAGPVCWRCPILVGRGCACSRTDPSITFWSDRHKHGCPMLTGHRSCLLILADRDEWESRSDRLLNVLAVLHGWAQYARDERKIKAPRERVLDRLPPAGDFGPIAVNSAGVAGTAREIPARLTIATERDLLSRQLSYIATRPWVMAMRAELAELRDALQRHNRNQDDRPLSGYCYRIVDGQECGGRLLPAAPVHTSSSDDQDDEEPDKPRAIACERNPQHRWEGKELARLALILEQQRRDERAAAMPPPAPSAGPQLRVLSTAGQGSRLDPLLEEQRRLEAQTEGITP